MPDSVNIAVAARSEYDRRLAKGQSIESAGDLSHEIADQLHQWQRIAWLLDPAGRQHGEQLYIDQDDLAGMVDEAWKCRDIWFAKCDASNGDLEINRRARGLAHISLELEIRAAALKKANAIGRRRGALAREKAVPA